MNIPIGKISTYSEIAEQIGHARAVRTVASGLRRKYRCRGCPMPSCPANGWELVGLSFGCRSQAGSSRERGGKSVKRIAESIKGRFENLDWLPQTQETAVEYLVISWQDNPECRTRFDRTHHFQARVEQFTKTFDNRKSDTFTGFLMRRNLSRIGAWSRS